MIVAILMLILYFIACLFLYSFLSIAVGWLVGWAASIICGNLICSGLALIGVIITPSQIPLLAAILCWIGSFFSTSVSVKKEKT
jgi:hypothetical protein